MAGKRKSGVSHTCSAREERRWQVRAVFCPPHTNAALSPSCSFLSLTLYLCSGNCLDNHSQSDMFQLSPPSLIMSSLTFLQEACENNVLHPSHCVACIKILLGKYKVLQIMNLSFMSRTHSLRHFIFSK